jgi:hypothetical protein
MVDNGENILVELDYDNISIIDPNKVIDSEGKPQERFVKQENLVYYANLECNVLPRTKLALGTALNDSIRTVSVAKINFLSPGNKTFLDNAYTDEITGKGTIKGEGVNQPKLNAVSNPNKPNDYYITQSLYSNGNPGAVDNGLLGITSIKVTINTSFQPVIDIDLEDVKGRALFEGGDNSPYASFFQLPYPIFYLTLKGYYGKAVRFPIMLQNFTSNFDPSTHNFKIKLKFYGYKYTIMSHINWGGMLAVPHMYASTINIANTSTTGTQNSTTAVTPKITSKGYAKMKELYANYKSKGLIPDDFPEITITQLKTRLDTFIKEILEKFEKENLGVLTDISNYTTTLNDYQRDVFFSTSSWAKKYLETDEPFVVNNEEKTKIYIFKKEITLENKVSAINELKDKLITLYNKILSENLVFGTNGKYVIDGKEKTSFIPNTIKYETFVKTNDIKTSLDNNIDLKETYIARNPGKKISGQTVIDEFKEKIVKELTPLTAEGIIGFWFEGIGSFVDQINNIGKKVSETKKTVEELITNAIQQKFSEKNNSLGFIPTIRNVMAVFFAQAEAFLRLLDDVHTEAWEVRENKYRKAAIFNKSSTAPSVDYKSVVENDTPVYPWPQLIVESLGENKEEKFEIKYPGDVAIAAQFKTFIPEIWPEVEFVEQFIKGYTERESPEPAPDPQGNVNLRPNRVSLNALDFPVTNEVYQNVEELRFFYEVYERIIMNSLYSRLNRKSGYDYGVYNVESEAEKENILKALGDDNPFLSKKLKNFNINANNFLAFLRHISNQGEGESWQKFIRSEFTTSYIKNEIENPTSLINQSILVSDASKPDVTVTNEGKLNDYLSNVSASNNFEFGDLYPLTNLDWDKKYLADGKALSNATDAYKTSDVLLFNIEHKSISNFLTTDTNDIKRPFTNFNFKSDIINQTLDLSNLKTFYSSRKIEEQFVTEGNLNYINYSGSLVYNQTTSMLNTPYFVNAIQKGVFNYRFNTNDLSSYKLAAYLFLNSLPLATLKEKYKTFNASTDLSYIFSTLKKFGAIHKLPYPWILKYGSIWHRYKVWKKTNVDILDDVWKNFDYKSNYDPANSATTRAYSVTAYTNPYEIILQNNSPIVNNSYTTNINLGFYPKVLDDFNVFYQGLKIFTGGTQLNGVCKISGTTMEVVSVSDNILTPGQVLFGNSIISGTTIVNQISGTTGSTGTYTVSISQSVPQDTIFVIPNAPKTGISSAEVQSLINSDKLYLLPSDGSKITKSQGFDTNNLNRSLNLKTWSAASLTATKSNVYLLPSFGSNVNQISSECFKQNGTSKIELFDNPAIYDGSVRSFWVSPHYGYFDHSRLTKTNPEQYLKEIFNDKRIQQNFLIDGDPTKYTKIDELFSTFEKEVLDLFENEFLNFSRSCYDYKSTLESSNTLSQLSSTGQAQEDNQNFQFLMRKLMKVAKPTQTTPDAIITELTNLQKSNFISIMDNFLNYNVILRNGNPTNFDKKLFYTFSNQYIVDPITYQGYNQGAPGLLPSNGGNITLAQSKAIYPEAWNALETYVGFSEIPELRYSSNGSYITDFFIDVNVKFTEKNVIDFTPLIKIYATEKLKDPTLNGPKFFDLMNQYLIDSKTYIDNVINVMMPAVRAGIKDIDIVQTNPGKSNLFGEQTKVELWELFKSINDTWIAGYDLKTKTLFEDVLIFDRASRDVGQKILVDIFQIKELIDKRQYDNNFLDIVNTVLTQNNFVYFNLPSFANFYNVQDAVKTPIPRNEGTLEFANTLFGTFLNLDYRETSPKLLCYYSNKTSEHLDMKNNIDYRFRNDAFDLRRTSDNPLIQNLQNKTDWDKSNKVVGFNIDIGRQNQQIFKQFDVSQNPGKPTAESLEVLNQMANIDKNRTSSTQNNSLYNLYKNRSYGCSVDMMGNALIQPMMYFNLRNVPMFSGPYLITSVSHSITENGFDTTFEGTRQPFYALPKIENFIQSLSVKLLKTIQEKIEEKNKQIKFSEGNILNQKSIVLDNAFGGDETLSKEQTCSDKLAQAYKAYTTVDSPKLTSITFADAKKKIFDGITASFPSLSEQSTNEFMIFIFTSMYVDSGTKTGFSAYENNYSTIPLSDTYGAAGNKYFNSKYICVDKGDNINNIPLATFNSFEDYLNFFISKFAGKLTTLKNADIKKYAEVYVLNWPIEQPRDVYDKLLEEDKKRLEDKFTEGYNLIVSSNPVPGLSLTSVGN